MVRPIIKEEVIKEEISREFSWRPLQEGKKFADILVRNKLSLAFQVLAMHDELVRVYALLRKDLNVAAAVHELKHPTEDSDEDALKQVIFDACDLPEIQLQSYTGILSAKRKRRYADSRFKKKCITGEANHGDDDGDDEDVDEDIHAADDNDRESDNDKDSNDENYFDANDGIVENESTMTRNDCTDLEAYQETVQVGQCR